jgi:hypothetical protein
MKRNNDAAVTEPSGISTAPPVVVGADRAAATRLSPGQLGPAANVDHFKTRPCDIAERLGEQSWIGRRIAGHQDEAAAAAQDSENAAG